MDAQHILVDGYNAIFRLPGLRDLARRDLERAREELVRRLAEALGRSGSKVRITVVFDGNQVAAGARGKRTGGAGKVAVLFSAPGETADQRIQRLVEAGRSAAKGRQAYFRVVSSDRELAGRAQLWGAEAVTCEAFMLELGRASSSRPEREPKPPPANEKEIAVWEELFRRRRADGEEEDAD
jgi:ribosomal protection tetracycline resistance protein